MGLIHNQILLVNENMIKEIMDSVPPNERPHLGEDTTAFFEAIQLPWRTEYTPKYVPRYVRDPATRNPPPPPVPEDVASSEDLETEMSLLDLEDSRSNPPGSPDPTVMGIKARSISDPDQDNIADTGLLPVIYYYFEDANIGTTILLDEGSNTSLITTKVAEALCLEGKIMLTTIL